MYLEILRASTDGYSDGWSDWSAATTTPVAVSEHTTTKPVEATTPTPSGSACVYTSADVVITKYGSDCGEWAETTTTTTTKPVEATTTPVSSCVYTSSGVVATAYGADCAAWGSKTTTTSTSTKPVEATTTSSVASCVYTSSGVVATGYGAECAEWADWTSSTTTSKFARFAISSLTGRCCSRD